MTGIPAGSALDSRPGWDRDEGVAAFYHAHYLSLARITALLVNDIAVGEEIVQAAFVSLHRLRRHLRDGEEALGYLRQY